MFARKGRVTLAYPCGLFLSPRASRRTALRVHDGGWRPSDPDVQVERLGHGQVAVGKVQV